MFFLHHVFNGVCCKMITSLYLRGQHYFVGMAISSFQPMLLDVADKRDFSRYGTIFSLNRIGYNVGLFLGKNIKLL